MWCRLEGSLSPGVVPLTATSCFFLLCSLCGCTNSTSANNYSLLHHGGRCLMTADSLWILWRRTYNESCEDECNNRSRAFYQSIFLHTSSVTGCVPPCLENRKHKLDGRLSERGSYCALILLRLPGGLTVVVSNVHIWPSPSAWIPLKFQRHWDTIIWLISEMEGWFFFSARAGDPPLTHTLPPTSLHLGGSDRRRTLMKAGRLHTSSRAPPADHPPLISSTTQDKRRALDAKYLEDTVPYPLDQTQHTSKKPLISLSVLGQCITERSEEETASSVVTPTSAVSFFLKVKAPEKNRSVKNESMSTNSPQDSNDKWSLC